MVLAAWPPGLFLSPRSLIGRCPRFPHTIVGSQPTCTCATCAAERKQERAELDRTRRHREDSDAHLADLRRFIGVSLEEEEEAEHGGDTQAQQAAMDRILTDLHQYAHGDEQVVLTPRTIRRSSSKVSAGRASPTLAPDSREESSGDAGLVPLRAQPSVRTPARASQPGLGSTPPSGSSRLSFTGGVPDSNRRASRTLSVADVVVPDTPPPAATGSASIKRASPAAPALSFTGARRPRQSESSTAPAASPALALSIVRRGPPEVKPVVAQATVAVQECSFLGNCTCPKCV